MRLAGGAGEQQASVRWPIAAHLCRDVVLQLPSDAVPPLKMRSVAQVRGSLLTTGRRRRRVGTPGSFLAGSRGLGCGDGVWGTARWGPQGWGRQKDHHR